ncbi:MAG: DUF3883 domain-containing protein [Anaerolineales bacterium]
MMDPENALALVVSYYLSRFNREAYANLGFTTLTEGHRRIGAILGVNPNTVKNMRDEFDPIHDNSRVGWWQRDIRPSRQNVVEAFQDLGKYELRTIVKGILEERGREGTEGLDLIIERVVESDLGERPGDAPYIVRGPTGRAAEEAFMEKYEKTSVPVAGDLIDTRDLGCGYDFEIRTDDRTVLVEVKGLKTDSGGVLFTAKEWEVARTEGDRYYLVLVRNLRNRPTIDVIHNPANWPSARRSLTTTIQVRWQIGQDEISRYLESHRYVHIT